MELIELRAADEPYSPCPERDEAQIDELVGV